MDTCQPRRRVYIHAIPHQWQGRLHIIFTPQLVSAHICNGYLKVLFCTLLNYCNLMWNVSMRNIKLLFCYELEIFNVGNWISSHVVEWNTANEANCRECMHSRGGNHSSKTLLSNWTRAPLLSWLAPKVAKYRDNFMSGKKSWRRSTCNTTNQNDINSAKDR